MHSSRRLNPRYEDLNDEWKDKVNTLIEFIWAEPAHRRPSSLHLVDPAAAPGPPTRPTLDQFLQTISATRHRIAMTTQQRRRFLKAR